MKYKVENFTPHKGRVIIEKMKDLFRMVESMIPDDEKNAGKDPIKDVLEVKKVKEKAFTSVQLGRVIAAHPEDPFKVGQVVAFGIHTVKEFDLFKGKHGLLDIYNVLGVYNEDVV